MQSVCEGVWESEERRKSARGPGVDQGRNRGLGNLERNQVAGSDGSPQGGYRRVSKNTENKKYREQ